MDDRLPTALREVVPLATLVGLVVLVALVRSRLHSSASYRSFVLVVGIGVLLLYIVARGMQLAEG